MGDERIQRAPTQTEAVWCRFCAHGNPAGAKFCNECGSPLHLRPCAFCNAINRAEATRCHACDAALPLSDDMSRTLPGDASAALPVAALGAASTADAVGAEPPSLPGTAAAVAVPSGVPEAPAPSRRRWYALVVALVAFAAPAAYYANLLIRGGTAGAPVPVSDVRSEVGTAAPVPAVPDRAHGSLDGPAPADAAPAARAEPSPMADRTMPPAPPDGGGRPAAVEASTTLPGPAGVGAATGSGAPVAAGGADTPQAAPVAPVARAASSGTKAKATAKSAAKSAAKSTGTGRAAGAKLATKRPAPPAGAKGTKAAKPASPGSTAGVSPQGTGQAAPAPAASGASGR